MSVMDDLSHPELFVNGATGLVRERQWCCGEPMILLQNTRGASWVCRKCPAGHPTEDFPVTARALTGSYG